MKKYELELVYDGNVLASESYNCDGITALIAVTNAKNVHEGASGSWYLLFNSADDALRCLQCDDLETAELIRREWDACWVTVTETEI